MNKKTVTGRKPSQPELHSLNPGQAEDALAAFLEQHPDLYTKFWNGLCAKAAESKGDTTGVNKGTFRHKSPQAQQIPRGDLVNMDYAVIEQRVTAFNPALGAPYDPEKAISADEFTALCRQHEKDNADE